MAETESEDSLFYNLKEDVVAWANAWVGRLYIQSVSQTARFSTLLAQTDDLYAVNAAGKRTEFDMFVGQPSIAAQLAKCRVGKKQLLSVRQ